MQVRFESTVARDRFVARQMWITALNFVKQNPDESTSGLEEYLKETVKPKRKYRGLPGKIVEAVAKENLKNLMEGSASERTRDYALKTIRFLGQGGFFD